MADNTPLADNKPLADNRQPGSLWTAEEDVILLLHVSKHGTKHWGFLQSSGVLPHRDQKACCNRFILLKKKFFHARARGERLTFSASQHEAQAEPPSQSQSQPLSQSQAQSQSQAKSQCQALFMLQKGPVSHSALTSQPVTASDRLVTVPSLSASSLPSSVSIHQSSAPAHEQRQLLTGDAAKCQAPGGPIRVEPLPQALSSLSQDEPPLAAAQGGLGLSSCLQQQAPSTSPSPSAAVLNMEQAPVPVPPRLPGPQEQGHVPHPHAQGQGLRLTAPTAPATAALSVASPALVAPSPGPAARGVAAGTTVFPRPRGTDRRLLAPVPGEPPSWQQGTNPKTQSGSCASGTFTGGTCAPGEAPIPHAAATALQPLSTRPVQGPATEAWPLQTQPRGLTASVEQDLGREYQRGTAAMQGRSAVTQVLQGNFELQGRNNVTEALHGVVELKEAVKGQVDPRSAHHGLQPLPREQGPGASGSLGARADASQGHPTCIMPVLRDPSAGGMMTMPVLRDISTADIKLMPVLRDPSAGGPPNPSGEQAQNLDQLQFEPQTAMAGQLYQAGPPGHLDGGAHRTPGAPGAVAHQPLQYNWSSLVQGVPGQHGSTAGALLLPHTRTPLAAAGAVHAAWPGSCGTRTCGMDTSHEAGHLPGDECPSSLSPDAALERFASSPVESLFGRESRKSLEPALLDLHAMGEALTAHQPDMDLWDYVASSMCYHN